MDFNIGDNMFYTQSTRLRVPTKVVGHSDEGCVELEYHQDGVRVINHHCPMDALSFSIPSWDSPPPTPSSPPAADIPGDATGGSPLRGCSPTPSPSSPPAADINIIWICPLAPGTSADVLIWDGYGPSRTRGDFFDFEVGGHDGAYKGRIHVIVPFIGRKNGTLTARQQCYNDVRGWYRAHIEQLFARLWHWGLVRNMWRGGPNQLHQLVRILLHFTQFCIRRQVRHPPLRTMGACPASRLD